MKEFFVVVCQCMNFGCIMYIELAILYIAMKCNFF